MVVRMQAVIVIAVMTVVKTCRPFQVAKTSSAYCMAASGLAAE